MLAPAPPTVSLDHLGEDQAAALLLAMRPGTTYRDVAAKLGVEPAVVLRWLRDGLRQVAVADRGDAA